MGGFDVRKDENESTWIAEKQDSRPPHSTSKTSTKQRPRGKQPTSTISANEWKNMNRDEAAFDLFHKISHEERSALLAWVESLPDGPVPLVAPGLIIEKERQSDYQKSVKIEMIGTGVGIYLGTWNPIRLAPELTVSGGGPEIGETTNSYYDLITSFIAVCPPQLLGFCQKMQRGLGALRKSQNQ